MRPSPRPQPRIAVEVCVGDVHGALAAEACGAERVELCADLPRGGTTPSLGVAATVLRHLRHADVRLMIRPRAGDFHSDTLLMEAAMTDIAALRALDNPRDNPRGLRIGFVFGALTEAGALDEGALRSVRQACGPYPTTLHKAFDDTRDQRAALETAIDLGFDRVLTSGGSAGAAEGAGRLAELVAQADGRITILAGGGIRPHNAAAVVEATGVREIHLRAPMTAHGTETTDPALVAAVVAAVRRE